MDGTLVVACFSVITLILAFCGFVTPKYIDPIYVDAVQPLNTASTLCFYVYDH